MGHAEDLQEIIYLWASQVAVIFPTIGDLVIQPDPTKKSDGFGYRSEFYTVYLRDATLSTLDTYSNSLEDISTNMANGYSRVTTVTKTFTLSAGSKDRFFVTDTSTSPIYINTYEADTTTIRLKRANYAAIMEINISTLETFTGTYTLSLMLYCTDATGKASPLKIVGAKTADFNIADFSNIKIAYTPTTEISSTDYSSASNNSWVTCDVKAVVAELTAQTGFADKLGLILFKQIDNPYLDTYFEDASVGTHTPYLIYTITQPSTFPYWVNVKKIGTPILSYNKYQTKFEVEMRYEV